MRVFIQIQQLIGKLIQREPDLAKSIRQSFEHVIQFAAASHHMRGNKLKVRPTDLLVKLDVWSATQTASLRVLVKNSADEQRVITNMRAKQECLFRSGAIQRDQDIGNVLLSEMMCLLGNLEPARARKCFQQRRDVIAKLPVSDSALLQDVASEYIKVKLRRDVQLAAVIQNSVDQPRMIQNGIARFDIAQEIDKRNLVGLRTRQRAHDEVEIGCGKPRPTIRSDHRDFIMCDPRPCGKQDC